MMLDNVLVDTCKYKQDQIKDNYRPQTTDTFPHPSPHPTDVSDKIRSHLTYLDIQIQKCERMDVRTDVGATIYPSAIGSDELK